MLSRIYRVIVELWSGIAVVLCLSIVSLILSTLPFFAHLHISPLIIGIFLSMGISLIQFMPKTATFPLPTWQKGIGFSSKKLLRLGIVFYGFFVSLNDLQNVGLIGFSLSLGVVVLVLGIGFVLGTKLFKLDRELAILISAGCAICGAAAVLALESALRTKAFKGIIAVGTVVVFGLLGMFLYPLLFNLGVIPFDDIQEGLYMGATLYEVANVVGASNAISQEGANIALITKMIRVMLLALVLLVIPFLFDRFPENTQDLDSALESTTNSNQASQNPSQTNTHRKKTLYIPYFALWFLAVICLHSFITLPKEVIDCAKFLSVLLLTMAMCALGLQIDYRQFVHTGGSGFYFAFVLFVLVSGGGFLAVYSIT